MDINSVTLIGRLSSDCNLHTFDNGGGICQFSIATNRSTKKDDKYVDEPSFIPVKYSSKGAENFSKFLVKGKMVAVSGKLVQERWEKDGKKSSSIIVYAADVQLLGSNKPSENTGNQSESQTSEDDFIPGGEDIPF